MCVFQFAFRPVPKISVSQVWVLAQTEVIQGLFFEKAGNQGVFRKKKPRMKQNSTKIKSMRNRFYAKFWTIPARWRPPEKFRKNSKKLKLILELSIRALY